MPHPDAELAATLRAWRDRLRPEDVGLPYDAPRRASGLRREELAALAGMSVDYLVRLEQGRATAPSVPVVSALARTLRLSDSERAHLFRLAGQRTPEPTVSSSALPDAVRRLLEHRQHDPLGVYDPAWTLLAWTPSFAALLGDPSAGTGQERNVLWAHFTARPTRISHSPNAEQGFERAAVADLRLAAARFPDDPGVDGLVRELLSTSPRFAELWAAHSIAEHVGDTKTVHHPQVGPVTLDCDVFTVPGIDARIVSFTAADDDASGKLALLQTIGTQKLSGRADGVTT